jgi:hypothetical protein
MMNQTPRRGRQSGSGTERGSPSRGKPQAAGKPTAMLIATACSNPPEACKRWALDLLAGGTVRPTAHEAMSREKVRRAKDDLKP